MGRGRGDRGAGRATDTGDPQSAQKGLPARSSAPQVAHVATSPAPQFAQNGLSSGVSPRTPGSASRPPGLGAQATTSSPAAASPTCRTASASMQGVELDAVDADLFDRWRRRREREGARVDVIDLYELVAAERGVAPDDLPLDERKALAARALEVIWPGFEKVAEAGRLGAVELVDVRPVLGRPLRVVARPPRGRPRRGRRQDRAHRLDLGARAVREAHRRRDGQRRGPRRRGGLRAGLRGLGLALSSRDDEHRFFVDAVAGRLEVQAHVCRSRGAFERDHLLFRDYLRSHDEARDAYGEMKRAAAARWREDRQGYTYAKTDLVLELLALAESWAAATGWSAVPSP